MKGKYKPIDWSKCPENLEPIGNSKKCFIADILPNGKSRILFLSNDSGIHINKFRDRK